MSTLILCSSSTYVAQAVADHLRLLAHKKTLLFITTAADIEKGGKQWLRDDRQALENAGFALEQYTIEGKNYNELREKFQLFHILYFSGGNTFFLLQEIQKSGCKTVLQECLKNGKIYMGSSAGSIVAGPDVSIAKRLDTLSRAPELQGMIGLELVNYTVLPHWGSEHFRSVYKQRIPEAYDNYTHPLLALHDNEFALVVDGKTEIVRVV